MHDTVGIFQNFLEVILQTSLWEGRASPSRTPTQPLQVPLVIKFVPHHLDKITPMS